MLTRASTSCRTGRIEQRKEEEEVGDVEKRLQKCCGFAASGQRVELDAQGGLGRSIRGLSSMT